jgi:hypothetical protein
MGIRERAVDVATKARDQRLKDSAIAAERGLANFLGVKGKIIERTENVTGHGTVFDIAEPGESPLFVQVSVTSENGMGLYLVRPNRNGGWTRDGGGWVFSLEDLGNVLLAKEADDKRR